MSMVNYETGELTEVTYAQVRDSVTTTKTHLEKAAEEIVWQIENRTWLVLGYADWDEMREAEYKGAAVIVPRADRPELSARLRSKGLSQQQIADTLGVSQRQVSTDIRSTSNIEQTVTRTDSLGRERPMSYKPREPKPALPDNEWSRERAAESERFCIRENLKSILRLATSDVLTPEALATSGLIMDVLPEFDPDRLEAAAAYLTHLAKLRRSNHVNTAS